jgi:predicted nucleic acid-binding protein
VFLLPGATGQGSVRSARRWGQLSAALGHVSADLLIAATALEHGLTVVTCNLRHFTPIGVATLNPWQSAGEG